MWLPTLAKRVAALLFAPYALAACSAETHESRRSLPPQPAVDVAAALTGGALPVPKIVDYWNGAAHFALQSTVVATSLPINTPVGLRTATGLGGGQITVAPDGSWILVRAVDANGQWPDDHAAACPQRSTKAVYVHKSTDQGRTWSNGNLVVGPNIATPHECASTDGFLRWSGMKARWEYLYQCSGHDNVWRGCLVANGSTDPTAGWWVDYGQKIASGQIASICSNPSNRQCYLDKQTRAPGVPVTGEGTFDVFGEENVGGVQRVYANFHVTANAYAGRMVAYTDDWNGQWVAASSDTFLGPSFVDGWNVPAADGGRVHNWRGIYGIPNSAGVSAGVGHGSSLYEDGQWYFLAEAMDLHVAFPTTPEGQAGASQNWVNGLVRSSNFWNTGPRMGSQLWENIPAWGGNPVLSNQYGAGKGGTGLVPGYSRLFRDADGSIYLSFVKFEVGSESMKIFRLVPGATGAFGGIDANESVSTLAEACRQKIPAGIATTFHMASSAALESDWGRLCTAANHYDAVAQMQDYARSSQGCDTVVRNGFTRYLGAAPTAGQLAAWKGPWDAPLGGFKNCALYNVGNNIKSYSKTYDGCRFALGNAFRAAIARAPEDGELAAWSAANCGADRLAQPWEAFNPVGNVAGWFARDEEIRLHRWENGVESDGGITNPGRIKLERFVVNPAATQIMGRRKDPTGRLHAFTWNGTWGDADLTPFAIDRVVQSGTAGANVYVIRSSDGRLVAVTYSGGNWGLAEMGGPAGLLDITASSDGTRVFAAYPGGVWAWIYQCNGGCGWSNFSFSTVPTKTIRLAGASFEHLYALQTGAGSEGLLRHWYWSGQWYADGVAMWKTPVPLTDIGVSADGAHVYGSRLDGAGVWVYFYNNGWQETGMGYQPAVNLKKIWVKPDGATFYGIRADNAAMHSWWISAGAWRDGDSFGPLNDFAVAPDGQHIYYTR